MNDRLDCIIERSARGALEGLTIDHNPPVKLLRPTKDNCSRSVKVRMSALSVETGDEAEQLSGPVIVFPFGAPD
jgi:hypothetical protein